MTMIERRRDEVIDGKYNSQQALQALQFASIEIRDCPIGHATLVPNEQVVAFLRGELRQNILSARQAT
jgi:hypothetical protein